VQAQQFRGAVVHRHEHRPLTFFDRGRQGVVAGSDFIGRAVMIVPMCRFSAFRNMRDGASYCASRISRNPLAFDVRTRLGGSFDFLDSEL
jgi:hypothetical protein